MTEEMGVLTRLEIDRLMRSVSREKARVVKEFVTKAYALGVGEEFFQCHISCLPQVDDLNKLLNDESSVLRFRIWPTINGLMVKREA